MLNNKFIQSFNKIPKELFRLNHGPFIRLRAHPAPVRPRGKFDLLTEAGMFRPLALNPASYEWPNGASMRPNSQMMQSITRSARGPSIYVYTVPEGTILPDDLILVHEFRDHYSLQARTVMIVEVLNTKITDFLRTNGELLTKDEWQKRHPRATESVR